MDWLATSVAMARAKLCFEATLSHGWLATRPASQAVATLFYFFIFYFLYHFIDLEVEPMMVIWWSIHEGPSLGI